MTQKQKQLIILGILVFIVYTFVTARPVPVETILSPQWFVSLESNYPIANLATLDDVQAQSLVPFKIGNRFGYVNLEGNFTINQIRKGNGGVSLSHDNWAEYDSIPSAIEVRDPINRRVLTINGPRGYPFFLDKRIFMLGNEQNSLSALDDTGSVLWNHDFTAPLTAIDAAANLVLAGLLDGTVAVLNEEGQRVFFFEPGGSRLAVILGCAISMDGSKLAIVSGIDPQRFLLLERYGDAGIVEYKVIYHEFLEEGFRRPVHIEFIDQDRSIAFERQGGLGLYEISSRTSLKIPLEGTIKEIDHIPQEGLLFLITAQAEQEKTLVVIRLPGMIMLEAPFRSENVFLACQGLRIYVGGNMTLASFELEKK